MNADVMPVRLHLRGVRVTEVLAITEIPLRVYPRSMAGYWAASLKLSENLGMPLCRSNNSQRLSGQRTAGS